MPASPEVRTKLVRYNRRVDLSPPRRRGRLRGREGERMAPSSVPVRGRGILWQTTTRVGLSASPAWCCVCSPPGSHPSRGVCSSRLVEVVDGLSPAWRRRWIPASLAASLAFLIGRYLWWLAVQSAMAVLLLRRSEDPIRVPSEAGSVRDALWPLPSPSMRHGERNSGKPRSGDAGQVNLDRLENSSRRWYWTPW